MEIAIFAKEIAPGRVHF